MFHVNPTTGDVGKCRARSGKCPFGGDSEHFTTEEAAREFFEKSEETARKITGAREAGGEVVYDMRESNLAAAEKAILQANKKLERAGVEQRFDFTVEEYMAVDGKNPIKAEPRVKLTLSSPAIHYEGYTFLAAVEKADAGYVVKQAGGINLYGYVPDDLTCEACGRAIQRQKTYLVEDSDGKMIQVGSGCVKKYFGVQPEGLWALTYDPIEKAQNSASWSSGNSAAWAADTEQVMAYALAVSDGGENFVSQSASYNWGGSSTADNVKTAIYGNDNSYAKEMQDKALEFVANGEAKRLLKKLQSSDTSTDYGRNLNVISSGEYTRWEHINILVSGVSQLAREKREAAKAAAEKEWGTATPGFAANVGDSIAGRKLKVKKVTHREQQDNYSYYGGTVTTTQLIFRDEDNHEVVWWSSKSIDVNVGDTLSVKSGRVKKHGSFNGVDQTVLTRVRLDLPKTDES